MGHKRGDRAVHFGGEECKRPSISQGWGVWVGVFTRMYYMLPLSNPTSSTCTTRHPKSSAASQINDSLLRLISNEQPLANVGGMENTWFQGKERQGGCVNRLMRFQRAAHDFPVIPREEWFHNVNSLELYMQLWGGSVVPLNYNRMSCCIVSTAVEVPVDSLYRWTVWFFII